MRSTCRIKTIRCYEQLGLLDELERQSPGYWQYDD